MRRPVSGHFQRWNEDFAQRMQGGEVQNNGCSINL